MNLFSLFEVRISSYLFLGLVDQILSSLIVNLQPLFRKIAAALPGMETLSSTKQEDMVDVNLKPAVNSSQAEQQGGGCAC